MKTYHMYHTESISAESKLKEFEKQEERQIGRTGDPVFNVRLEDKTPRRSFVKKIEKMKEKVLNNSLTDFCGWLISYNHHTHFLDAHNDWASAASLTCQDIFFTNVIPVFYALDLF